MLEKLEIIEDVLIRCLFSGLILFLFSFLIYLLFNEQIINMWREIYGIPKETVSVIVVCLYGFAKIMIVTCFMIPAIGIHWARKSLKKKA